MRWFDGTVVAAISAAKQRNVLFVVYVRGDDEVSTQMDATWEDPEVSQLCQDSGMVAIKFDAKSEECKQFSQFYPVICIPCVSFISGLSGVPLEGTAGFMAASDFVEKIRKVMEMAKQTAPPSTGQASSSAASLPAAAASSSSSGSTSSSSGADAAAAASPDQEPRKELSKLEKAARLRQKMEEIHQRKEAKQEEESRQKEMERRKVGQAVQKSMQERKDQEIRQAAQDMRRERAEDQLAKERVREQIARDRAEKQARYEQIRQEKEEGKQAAAAARATEQAAGETTQRKVNMDIARIQFRLPDGSTLTTQFDANAPLSEALQFLQENMGNSLREFTMSTTFPRRTFAQAELGSTFLELDLVPTAAVIVLPGRFAESRPKTGSSAVQPASSSGGVLATILAPLLFLWNLIVVFIFGQRDSQSQPEPAASQAPVQQGAPSPSAATGARPDSSQLRRRVPAGDKFASRQEGNIHRLVTAQDEDDDNNTWNGNSTQQM